MTSRTIARRRALATTARESMTTGGGTPASETPGSRVRRTGLSIAKCSTFGGVVLFQIIVAQTITPEPQKSANPNRLRDVISVRIAICLDHDRIVRGKLRRCRIRSSFRANRQIFERVDAHG